jgi:eukaryotic-like serine/threonine-protein kinase
MKDYLTRVMASVRDLVSNHYFWIGILLLAVVGAGIYLLVNNLLMPSYTRHDVSVSVPSLINHSAEEARLMLENRDLQVRVVVQRFNPTLPRDVVVDQNPPPDALVKPGRQVYMTVNSGTQRMVRVPSLEGMSLREAQNRLQAAGLRVDDIRADSIPSPYPNTVTRQSPTPADSVAEGASVTLWYSTGLGDQYVTVPDVTGLTVAEARQLLREYHLRYVVIGAEEGDDDVSEFDVARQSREPGTRVREGFEIRLYIHEESEAPRPGGIEW